MNAPFLLVAVRVWLTEILISGFNFLDDPRRHAIWCARSSPHSGSYARSMSVVSNCHPARQGAYSLEDDTIRIPVAVNVKPGPRDELVRPGFRFICMVSRPGVEPRTG